MTAPTLIDLYRASSKHSQYQMLPERVRRLLAPESITCTSRHERERLAFICGKLDFRGRRVADIGGNTGYFTFEILDRGATSVDHFEGNADHSLFVSRAARQLGLEQRLRTHARYLDFGAPFQHTYDVVLLLNVLHHIGDDYGDLGTGADQVLLTVRESLATMALHARHLVFQLGFNWKGDRNQPIFQDGSRANVIDFVRELRDAWDIEAVGIARRIGGEVVYEDMSATNVARDDSLGEFLNRPLFILRSRCLPAK